MRLRNEANPLVSILILNYNGLKYVDRCLTSVFNTVYPRFEVIFIDNASKDGSYEYVKWNLEQVRTVLTPRVIAGPKDQVLVEQLIQLDQEYRELQHAVIAHKEVCTQSIFPWRIVALVKAVADCYAALLPRFKEISPKE